MENIRKNYDQKQYNFFWRLQALARTDYLGLTKYRIFTHKNATFVMCLFQAYKDTLLFRWKVKYIHEANRDIYNMLIVEYILGDKVCDQWA